MSAPRRLTAQNIARYNRDGLVQPFDIAAPDEIARIRACTDRLKADLGETGAYGFTCYRAGLAGLWDIATEPRILDCVHRIAGADGGGTVANSAEFLARRQRSFGLRA